ncbi:nuclear transport factor 2 family protein [soil metagenome]
MTDVHIALSDAQEVLSKWWFHYDAGDMEVVAELFTDDAHFSCRSDSGESEWEEFVRADLTGRDNVMEWQAQHRADSPYPLRHHGTNFHVTGRNASELTFASYILVTHVEGVMPVGVSSAVVNGTIRVDGDGVLRLSTMELVLDMTTSVPFKDRARPSV